MDFSRNSSQPAPVSRASNVGQPEGKKNNSWRSSPRWLRLIWITFLFAGTVLVISVVALLYVGGDKESKQIDKSKFQAVFLTNGQVYFGNVVTANRGFVDLKNIYYLSVNQQVQPKDNKDSSVSLVKLGCELHGPVDEMMINRDQVTFWENLRTDGQVSQAIDKWVAQNPEGQKCTAPSAQLNTVLKDS